DPHPNAASGCRVKHGSQDPDLPSTTTYGSNMTHTFRKLSLTALAAAALGALSPVQADTAAGGDVAARVKAFDALLAEQWEYTLKDQPEFATTIRDYRYNDRFSDASLAHTLQQKKDAEEFLARFQAVDTGGFPEQERLSQELMVQQLKDTLRGIELKTYEMPLDQFNGFHLQLAQFVSLVPLDSTKHYEDYLARLHQVPRVFDQAIEVLKQGEKDGLMPPKFLLEKVVTQARSIGEPAGEASVFGQPVTRFPDAVPEADRKRLHDAIIQAVDTEVRPAYQKLADFVEKDYAPKGRTQPGLWALPDGDALYRFAIHSNTTTDRDPEDIHQLGLAEVKRIEGEMTAIAHKLKYKDLKDMRAKLKTDPKVHATSRQQIVDLYTKYIAQMQPKLPELFGLLPKTQVKVVPVQEYREKEAAA